MFKRSTTHTTRATSTTSTAWSYAGRSMLAAAAVAGALMTTGAQGASAAAPVVIGYHQIAGFPTWFWGQTQFCAQNLEFTPGKYAKIRVTPASRPDLFDDVYVNPGQTTCIYRYWGAAPIVANNLSATGAVAKVWTS